MTPATAAALRCPVCGGPLLLAGRSLRCAKAHSFDLAKEGYAYLLPMQKKHAADPGDGKAMVRARRAFLSAGHYAPLNGDAGRALRRAAPRPYCGRRLRRGQLR